MNGPGYVVGVIGSRIMKHSIAFEGHQMALKAARDLVGEHADRVYAVSSYETGIEEKLTLAKLEEFGELLRKVERPRYGLDVCQVCGRRWPGDLKHGPACQGHPVED